MATKAIILLALIVATPFHVSSISITKDKLWSKTVIRIRANLTSESYKILIGTIVAVLREMQGTGDILSRPRLPPQLLHQLPQTLIVLELTGREDQTIELALRGDNLYLIAFKNKNGQWYEFKPADSSSGPLVPGAEVLSFGGHYSALFGTGGIQRNIKNYVMSKSTLLDAIGTLFDNPSAYISESDLKRALVTIVVMIIEASRLNPIRNKLFSGWPMGTTIDRSTAKYAVVWTKLSHYLLCMSYGIPWTHSDAGELTQMNIITLSDALAPCNIVLWTVNFDPNNVVESCKKASNNS